jgi:anti-sigma factor ChrR (cupin superfamily)
MAALKSTLIIEKLFLNGQANALEPWYSLNPGVEISYIYKDDTTGSAAAFIRYAPGTNVKHHEHLGYEHVIVLDGEQCDENYTYRSGCLAIQAPNSRHKVSSSTGCTVLAIWTAPLKFLSKDNDSEID